MKQQEASPANINTLSPEPDDDDEDDDDDVNNNDVDDDRPPLYGTSPLNATGGFVELTLPDMAHDTSDAFSSTADFTNNFYSE